MKNVLVRFWNWVTSPFRRVPATEEVVDGNNETQWVVVHKRPEEMAITRWAASGVRAVKEDIEDAVEVVEAGSPIMLIAMAYMGMVWMLWLLLRVFALAVKGASIMAILAEVIHITWVMVVVVLVMGTMYVVCTTLGVMAVRWVWKAFNKVMGRQRQGFLFSAANAFRKMAT